MHRSAQNALFNANGYWKGSTWIDQVWFAYTGLESYAASTAAAAVDSRGGVRGRPHRQGAVDLGALARTIKQRTLRVGQGFGANDTIPLNEHCASRRVLLLSRDPWIHHQMD
jgi:hypothetical protein